VVNCRIYSGLWNIATGGLSTTLYTKYNSQFLCWVNTIFYPCTSIVNIFIFIFTFYFCRTTLNIINEDAPLYWPVIHKLSNVQSQWPQNAIVLPGMSISSINYAL